LLGRIGANVDPEGSVTKGVALHPVRSRSRTARLRWCVVQHALCGQMRRLSAGLQAAARPTVNVYNALSDAGEVSSSVGLPGVFMAPIRRDVVHVVHKNLAKNSRQAYAVNEDAGHQHSAVSWGTGRAVSRIPRVASSGTHRSGQGAFGNMCRKGRMFAPTKIWRKWHRKVSVNQRRFATASAIAATGVTPLVMARGHRIEKLSEVPLVLDNLDSIRRIKEATSVLARFGAMDDVDRVKDSKAKRGTKGKMRNRMFRQRRGPLVVHAADKDSDAGRPLVELAFRNIPGVEVTHVDRLNLLQLAPGGHLGRFCIWTKGAFERLNALFGAAPGEAAELKAGFVLPRAPMANADIARLINSTEIQSTLNPKKTTSRISVVHGNPLRNRKRMAKLNPYSIHQRRVEILDAEAKAAGAARKLHKSHKDGAKVAGRKAASRNFYRSLLNEDWTFGSA
jgi:large subunit ribosomal protein L4e